MHIIPLEAGLADINLATRWVNGVWTFEVSRKLTKGSNFHVQFNHLSARYGFGFAAFNNAQVRHAVHRGPLYLSFAKQGRARVPGFAAAPGRERLRIALPLLSSAMATTFAPLSGRRSDDATNAPACGVDLEGAVLT